MAEECWALKLERDSEEKRQEQTTAERLDTVLDTAFCEVQADAIGRDMEPMLWCGDQQLVYQDTRNRQEQLVYQDTRNRQAAGELAALAALRDEGVAG